MSKRKILSLLCLTFTLFILLFCNTISVYASETVYTNVLDDLNLDSSFKESNYPLNEDDYSLQVIQVGESSDNELFIYVYQPSGQTKSLTATSINISTTIGDDISYKNYKLTLLNSSGVFFKYLVNNLTVSSDTTRYYDISSIYRAFDSSLGDTESTNENTTTEVAYDVSKEFCLGTYNGNSFCTVTEIDTIMITDKFVGFVRYPDGKTLFCTSFGSIDSHFVAFSTNYDIDKLLEADVYYTSQYWTYYWNIAGTETKYYDNETDKNEGEYDEHVVSLTYTDRVVINSSEYVYGDTQLGAKYTYEWDRIETVEDFIDNEDSEYIYSGALFNTTLGTSLTDSAKESLENQEWVLRFAETDYNATYLSSTIKSGTIVGDVTILRLKFETDGITYNLGVIDNKTTGSNDPVNTPTIDISISDNFKKILSIVLVIILLILLIYFCLPFLPMIISIVVKIIKLPFILIGKIIKMFKNSKGK